LESFLHQFGLTLTKSEMIYSLLKIKQELCNQYNMM
jgi:hypothetical protein